jgi:hypothetical protein
MTLSANHMVISKKVGFTIYMAITFTPFVFVNYKLFKISRKIRRNKAVSPEERTTINLKNINTCLLAVGCLAILSIPSTFYVAFGFASKSVTSSVRLSYVWSGTLYTINSTFNSLIFFWKNKVLRIEGLKILKTLKDRLF